MAMEKLISAAFVLVVFIVFFSLVGKACDSASKCHWDNTTQSEVCK